MSNCPTCGRPRWTGPRAPERGDCTVRSGAECVLYATVALYTDTLAWLRSTGHAGLVRRAIEVAKLGCPELNGEESAEENIARLRHAFRPGLDREDSDG